MPTPPKKDPAKNCKACGQALVRKRYGKRLEDRNRFLAREHCDQSCANKRSAIQADSHREYARRLVDRSKCSKCGKGSNIHVHHKDRNPANNNLKNLEALCASCHLKLHWAEDRAYRLHSMSIGGRMDPQLSGGKRSVVMKRRLLPKLRNEENTD